MNGKEAALTPTPLKDTTGKSLLIYMFDRCLRKAGISSAGYVALLQLKYPFRCADQPVVQASGFVQKHRLLPTIRIGARIVTLLRIFHVFGAGG